MIPTFTLVVLRAAVPGAKAGTKNALAGGSGVIRVSAAKNSTNLAGLLRSSIIALVDPLGLNSSTTTTVLQQ